MVRLRSAAAAFAALAFSLSTSFAQPPTPGAQPLQIDRLEKKTDALEKLVEDTRRAVDDRAASINQRLDRTDEKLDSFRPSPVRDWGQLIGTVVLALVALVSLYLNVRTTKQVAADNLAMADLTRKEKAREEERKAIREKIDQFYGPFVQLRGMSRYIYDTLFFPRRSEQETRDYSDGTRYRTILALVRGHKFGPEDQEILKKIVAIGKQTAELIQSKIGLVDDKDLLKVLPHAVVHFWLIEQLVTGAFEITDPASRPYFEKLTFPESLDTAVTAELARLNARLAALQD